MSVHVFGIRHHGPGCARSLRAALDALSPDCVLIEGPPDADEVIALAGEAGVRPPLALLVYPEASPRDASYYPFATFSPEWQAIRWALEKRVTVRFADLPIAHRAPMKREPGSEQVEASEHEGDPEDGSERAAESADERALAWDPIGVLAEAAGYSDREAWWEREIEQRQDPTGLFDGILEAMRALRATRPEPRGHEARREAWMRRTLRNAEKEGFARIAFVCGAWHAPALVDRPPAKHDDALLKGLPRAKTIATWIPWTHSRLTYASGYGAGVEAPGWYAHVFEAPDRAAIRWSTLAARLLRDADLDASSAAIIETVRLAEALAALRDAPLPGLRELREAVLTVMCHGDATPFALVRNALEIGEALGHAPEGAPAVPLARDVERLSRSLRLKHTTEIKELELDLRSETDRERSKLLRRLLILGIAWGTPSDERRGTGTFREAWTLAWKPELAIAIVEANVHGNTVETAAESRAIAQAHEGALGALTELLWLAVRADLPRAITALLGALQERAAQSADVRAMIAALPPLARVARYGDVRGTRVDAVLPIVEGLFERAMIALPLACASLDEEAAAATAEALGSVRETLELLDSAAMRARFDAVLASISENDALDAHVRGRACRLRLELGTLDEEGLTARARLALSPALEPRLAAAWLEGLVRGSALVLLHRDGLWAALDAWLSALTDDAFIALLPLVRRAFSEFSPAERREMGARLSRLAPGGAKARAVESEGAPIDEARAALVMPVLGAILGAASEVQA